MLGFLFADCCFLVVRRRRLCFMLCIFFIYSELPLNNRFFAVVYGSRYIKREDVYVCVMKSSSSFFFASVSMTVSLMWLRS